MRLVDGLIFETNILRVSPVKPRVRVRIVIRVMNSFGVMVRVRVGISVYVVARCTTGPRRAYSRNHRRSARCTTGPRRARKG